MNQFQFINNKQASHNHLVHSVNPLRLSALRQEWTHYLDYKNHDDEISKTDQSRLALTEFIYTQSLQDRTLFHVSLTYKPYQDQTYSQKSIDNFFKHFYTKHFLPYLMNTKNYHRNSHKSCQPICLAFTHEHDEKAVINQFRTSSSDIYSYPVRLHHHAIVAVHEKHLDRMQALVGDRTLADNQFSHKIMTSNVRECDAQCLLYASNDLKKYPDFLMFGTNEINQSNTKPIAKETLMTNTNEPLDKDLHIRIPEQFQQNLHEIAKLHHLKPSTFSRHILMNHLHEYKSKQDLIKH